MVKYKILYVDDLEGELDNFKQFIENPLKDKVEVDYAMAHINRGLKYKSVKQLMDEENKYDIVVVDLNLSKPPVNEGKLEGIAVLKTVKEKDPETLVAIITAYPEKVVRLAMLQDLEKNYHISPNLIIDKTLGTSESWILLRTIVQSFFLTVDRQRHIDALQESIKEEGIAPELYEVTIIHKNSISDPLAVIVKKNDTKIGFVLNPRQSMTFQTLALRDNPREFINLSGLVRRTNRLRWYQEDFEPLHIEDRESILEHFGIEEPKCDLNNDKLCWFAEGEEAPKQVKQGEECRKKIGLCVKHLYKFIGRGELPSKEYQDSTTKNHIREIRGIVFAKNQEFIRNNPSISPLYTCEHSKLNELRVFCGECLIYRRSSGGYALAAKVNNPIQLDLDDDLMEKLKELLELH